MYGNIYESLQAEKLLCIDEYFSGTEKLSINKTFNGNFIMRTLEKTHCFTLKFHIYPERL